MNLLFWLARKKARPNGETPIYAKIQVQGKRPAQFATGVWVQPEQWHPKGNGFISGTSSLVKADNQRLIDIRASINGIYADLERNRELITPQIIKAIFTGAIHSNHSLLFIAKLYVQKKKEEVGKGTKKNYDIRYNNLQKFLTSSKQDKILCREVSPRLLSQMEAYLKSNLHHEQSTANRNLKFVSAVMDLAVCEEVIPANPLLSYAFRKRGRKKKVYLEQHELRQLSEHKFASERLAKIALLFVFQCYTGLSYAEMARFSRAWVRPGINGRLWIFTDRQKVAGSICDIPLFPEAEHILKLCGYELPVPSNGKYNIYLKEVAFIVGIEKNLTTHVGRKTFGNVLLQKGVSLEAVSSMYGHSSTRTTQEYYVEVSAQQIAKETEHLMGGSG